MTDFKTLRVEITQVFQMPKQTGGTAADKHEVLNAGAGIHIAVMSNCISPALTFCLVTLSQNIAKGANQPEWLEAKKEKKL